MMVFLLSVALALALAGARRLFNATNQQAAAPTAGDGVVLAAARPRAHTVVSAFKRTGRPKPASL
jgi:hypothetical protein